MSNLFKCCLNCKERKLYCHNSCDIYLKAKEKKLKINKELRKELEADSRIYCHINYYKK